MIQDKQKSGPDQSFIRIYYEDTDFTGVVYHANYLRYFERARSDFLRKIGMGHRELLTYNPPRAFTIKNLKLDYFQPVRIEDLIEIRSFITRLGPARIEFSQIMLCRHQKMAHLEICVVGIDHEGKIQRFPKPLRNALNDYLTHSQAFEKKE